MISLPDGKVDRDLGINDVKKIHCKDRMMKR
jgi:hypothetical protein